MTSREIQIEKLLGNLLPLQAARAIRLVHLNSNVFCSSSVWNAYDAASSNASALATSQRALRRSVMQTSVHVQTQTRRRLCCKRVCRHHAVLVRRVHGTRLLPGAEQSRTRVRTIRNTVDVTAAVRQLLLWLSGVVLLPRSVPDGVDLGLAERPLGAATSHRLGIARWHHCNVLLRLQVC